MNLTHCARPSKAAATAAILLTALSGGLIRHVKASPYSDAVLQNNPIGYWRLGDLNPTTAFDASSNHLNGAYFGGAALGNTGAVLDDPNTSASFDGSSAYVQVSPTPLINQLRNNFTIEAWVKMSQGGGGELVSTRDTRVGFGGFGFTVVPNALKFTAFGVKDYILNLPISTDQWHLVDVAFTSSNATVFYLDGQQVGGFGGSSPAFTNTQPFDIGRDPVVDSMGLQYYFNGGIDEVAIYNHVLQPADVAEHYLVATTPEPPSLLLALFGGGALALWRTKRHQPGQAVSN